jgi:thiopurine S-methyltransferase
MQAEFWHRRWADNQIGFHESRVNPLLVAHLDTLALPRAARVLLPLCGKTVDIDWLLSRDHRVVGVELSGLAVDQLFERLGVAPAIESSGTLERRSIVGLDVLVGDIFQLSGTMLGAVDAVYDRAALVALPPHMRVSYARHLQMLTGDAPQLLVTLEYDQQVVDGPPFSVSAAEVRSLYPRRSPVMLSGEHQPQGLKGRYPVTEIAWKL